MWLLSQWEPLGNIVEYLAANQPDEETRLNLVRSSTSWDFVGVLILRPL